MKSPVRVAVIGGGVVGCSVLYHLVKHGWKDVALIERSELTAGSTWHAAGGMHTFNSDPNVAKLQDYTLKVYKEIEEASGQSCGIHLTGGLMLADTQDRSTTSTPPAAVAATSAWTPSSSIWMKRRACCRS